MNDQSVQSIQIPAEIKQFLDDILQQAGMVAPSEEIHQEMLKQMFEQLDQHLTAVILEKLPEDKIEAFIKMNEDQRPQEEIQTYLQQHIPQVNEVMANAFTQFRDMYLSNVAIGQNAQQANQETTKT